MDIKFPKQEDPFRKTMAQAIIASIATFIAGLFLGYCLGSLFGTNQSMINTTNYTDSMAAARTLFTDGDQLDSYITTGQIFRNMEGLRIYTSRDRETTMAWYDGKFQNSEELFDDTVTKSLRELMHTEEALFGVTNSLEEQIEGVELMNIAVQDGIVYYYLYYDEAGYVAIAFDFTGETLTNDTDYALPLTKTADDDEGYYQWFITYYIEE